MKMWRLIVAFFLCVGVVGVHAETSFGYHIIVIDKANGAPVEGAEIAFEFADPNQGNKIATDKCVTDAQGKCSATARVYSSFIVGGQVSAKFTARKNGYSPVFSRKARKIDDGNQEVTITLTALALLEQTSSRAQVWGLGEGPPLISRIFSKPKTLSELFASGGEATTPVRGKFEAEGDFTIRSLTSAKTVVAMQIAFDNSLFCASNYDHKSLTHVIEGCAVFPSNSVVQTTLDDSGSIVLSNAFDSRRIKIVREIKYQISGLSGFTWSAKFALSPREAEALESDLMAAAELEEFNLAKSCPACETRESSDRLDGALTSVGGVTGRSYNNTGNWKNEAFKLGAIREDWTYSITPRKVARYFVFRRSDGRVLYEMLAPIKE